ncbi:MAG: tRNA 2-thiocytidine(32) synthetase TtcA [Proteobacteria bacterium]|nr:tRNA 2-thiocytidine(32) synthetase TtcA [Pseudomonadota bacterium]
MAKKDPHARLVERLIKKIARTSIEYRVLAPNDRLLVAVSGGKDSYCLLYLLDRLRGRLPFSIDLVACHVSQGQPGVDPSPLTDWLAASGLPFEVVEQDTYSVVKRNTPEGQTACAVCARMRRGILYTTARRLGCNKLALGHHREDTLATLLLNLFFSGKIRAMPPSYTTREKEIEVIRPMIEVAEGDLIELSGAVGFPIVPCALCAEQKDHKRAIVGQMLDDLESKYPDIKNVMLGALKNVRPTHLLDPLLEKKPK